MKTFSQYRKEAQEAIKRVGVSTSLPKRSAKKKMMAGVDRDVTRVSVHSDPEPDTGGENDIHIGGNHLYYEDSENTYYIFHIRTNRVLAKGIRGYENTKAKANELRKRYNLKWDEVKFRVERKNNNTKKGRIDVAKNYNPSKRTHMRGVHYSDGSYADLD